MNIHHDDPYSKQVIKINMIKKINAEQYIRSYLVDIHYSGNIPVSIVVNEDETDK